jgi:hypothetical protein
MAAPTPSSPGAGATSPPPQNAAPIERGLRLDSLHASGVELETGNG